MTRHFRDYRFSLSCGECADQMRHNADMMEPFAIRIANILARADYDAQAIIERGLDPERLLDFIARIRDTATELESADMAAIETAIDF